MVLICCFFGSRCLWRNEIESRASSASETPTRVPAISPGLLNQRKSICMQSGFDDFQPLPPSSKLPSHHFQSQSSIPQFGWFIDTLACMCFTIQQLPTIRGGLYRLRCFNTELFVFVQWRLRIVLVGGSTRIPKVQQCPGSAGHHRERRGAVGHERALARSVNQ